MLEFIGLGAVIASFAVKVTRNAGVIGSLDETRRCTPWAGGVCGIFTWCFVLTAPPTVVTACAFLRTNVYFEDYIIICWAYPFPYFYEVVRYHTGGHAVLGCEELSLVGRCGCVNLV